jgi:HPt (histidine-containing phosphotransfer) domain-containing protein
MDLNRLFNQLIHIDQLDIWEGLSHTGCNRAVYADTLRLFCSDAEKRILAAYGFLENETWKEYTTAVHALKGGFASLGAWKIARQTLELENAAWEKKYQMCRKQSKPVFTLMKEFVAVLKATDLFNRDEQPKEKESLAFLAEKLRGLHKACSTGNCAIADSIAKELRSKTFDEKTDALAETLYGYVENVDYDLAIRDIDLWLNA